MKLNHIVKNCFSRATGRKQKFFYGGYKDYGTQPIIEGQHKMSPPLTVPDHIIRPDYVNNPNPQFGVYNGNAVVHNKEMQENMRIAGQTAAKTLSYICSQVKEGITTDELDKLIHQFIIDQDAYPTALGFMHFPKSVCSSVNEVCCHGIPDSRPLQNGDYINLDVTLFKAGVHGDNSAMVMVGDVHPEVQKLIRVTQEALYESIKICRPGVPFREIGNICEQIAHQNNLTVCELFTGHGVGEKLHMPPIVYHTQNESPFIMEPGNVFTIEPIFMLNPGRYMQWRDNFTVVSPGNPSAQWEHTILITEDGYEVITLREGEVIA